MPRKRLAKYGICTRRVRSVNCIFAPIEVKLSWYWNAHPSRKDVNVLAQLPFVREGLIIFELIPLKAYPGFERLFAKD